MDKIKKEEILLLTLYMDYPDFCWTQEMRIIFVILVIALLLQIGCTPKKSSHDDNKEILTTQSSNLDENIIESWGQQKKYFNENNFEIIDWDKAKNILLQEKIRGGKQYHTGWLTIYTMDNRKYLVKQPKMDALWEFMEAKGIKPQGFGTE